MSHSLYATHNIPAAGSVRFVQSYAKINLTLDVLGKRGDGYHELVTIMQTIDLYDTICLTVTEDDHVRIVCTQTELSNDDNLALRAAQAIRHHLGLTTGLLIELQKRIPVAAGLGGGSSNAAAVLLALQQWWQLPCTPADLLTLAAALGSDVPFFLTGGLALCEGRGERVTPLTARWPGDMRWLLLVKPAIGVSTALIFRTLPASDYSDGRASRRASAALQTLSGLGADDLHNGLERGVLERYPQVAQTREDILRAGATLVRLSGSGPTLFAPFADLTHAAHVQQQLQAQEYETYLTRAVPREDEEITFF